MKLARSPSGDGAQKLFLVVPNQNRPNQDRRIQNRRARFYSGGSHEVYLDSVPGGKFDAFRESIGKGGHALNATRQVRDGDRIARIGGDLTGCADTIGSACPKGKIVLQRREVKKKERRGDNIAAGADAQTIERGSYEYAEPQRWQVQ